MPNLILTVTEEFIDNVKDLSARTGDEVTTVITKALARYDMRVSTPDTVGEQIAGEFYDTYCAAVGGKAFNGDPLPKSEEFLADPTKAKQADAWRAVARKALGLNPQLP
jgi:hypothetical protein